MKKNPLELETDPLEGLRKLGLVTELPDTLDTRGQIGDYEIPCPYCHDEIGNNTNFSGVEGMLGSYDPCNICNDQPYKCDKEEYDKFQKAVLAHSTKVDNKRKTWLHSRSNHTIEERLSYIESWIYDNYIGPK